jgi:hypothetical protein
MADHVAPADSGVEAPVMPRRGTTASDVCELYKRRRRFTVEAVPRIDRHSFFGAAGRS